MLLSHAVSLPHAGELPFLRGPVFGVQSTYKAVQTKYLPIVGSEGGPHAEDLNIKKAAEWLRDFVAQHTDRGDYVNYRFDINVMIGFRPCETCITQESFDGWKNQIQEAVSHYGSYGGFRLRMWYLTQDPTGPKYSDGTPMRSAYHLYPHGDSGWKIFQWPRIQSPDGGVDDE